MLFSTNINKISAVTSEDFELVVNLEYFRMTVMYMSSAQQRCQWCLRMLLGIKWYQFVRNDDVRRLMKQPKLTAIIQLRRLSLFEHFMCMDNNADAKRILLASPPAD